MNMLNFVNGSKHISKLSQYTIIFFLLISIFGFTAYAQSNSDSMFLDDTFTEESASENLNNPTESTTNTQDTESLSNTETSSTVTSYDNSPQSLKILKFTINDRIEYAVKNSSNTQNKDELFYSSPWINKLDFNNYLSYTNADKWFGINLDYNLYFHMSSFEYTSKTNELDTDFNYELRDANVKFSLFNQQFTLTTGKLLRSHGSGYLVNPSFSLLKTTGINQAFAKNLSFHTYNTADSKTLIQEKGTHQEIGYWASELELYFYPVVWSIAYLPFLDTGFAEFDRPDHSIITSLKVSKWDSIKPSLLFYWYGTHYFIGGDLSLGVNDIMTTHLEFGLSSENELPTISKSGMTTLLPPNDQSAPLFAQNYTLDKSSQDGFFAEVLVGVNITPKYDSRALFNIIFELYYNGKGLWNDEWNQQLGFIKDIYNAYNDSQINTLVPTYSASYKGLLAVNRYYYHPLRIRPLYAIIRISRNNIFSALSQSINAETSIVYSLLDTTFAWNVDLEIVFKEIISIGLASNYYFGLAQGAFTELTDTANVSLYSTLKF